MIRVLIADDHNIVRDGLKRILTATADIEVAAEAASGDAALSQVKAGEFDVVVLDMSMPGLSGLDLIKRLRIEKPKLRILVLSMHAERQYAARVLKAGAAGYLNKDSAADALVAAIRKVAAGGMHIPEAAAAGLDAGSLDRLRLDETRLEGLAAQVETAAGLAPLERDAGSRTLPNGLRISERRIPIGTVGANFEARPNVALDVAGQLLKSLNPEMQVVMEVMLPQSIAFLTPTPPRCDALNSHPHLMAPAYIMGSGECCWWPSPARPVMLPSQRLW